MPQADPSSVTVHAPATVGNFGPGFDVLSLALAGLGDTLHVRRAEADRLIVEGDGAPGVPVAWSENTATRAIDHLRKQTGFDDPLEVRLVKAQAPGSGLGSSASSAGGGALAFRALFGDADLTPTDLVVAAGAAEAAGSVPHHDDVAAVVLGGLAVVRPAARGATPMLRRIQPPERLHLAVLLPELRLLTSEMRALLPDTVARVDAIANLARVATLVDAMHLGDIEAIGASFEDRIAAPHRATRIPFFDAVRDAARSSGAYGCGLAGSGPAMIAVCDDDGVAAVVAEAMAEAVRERGTHAIGVPARPEGRVMYDAVQVR